MGVEISSGRRLCHVHPRQVSWCRQYTGFDSGCRFVFIERGWPDFLIPRLDYSCLSILTWIGTRRDVGSLLNATSVLLVRLSAEVVYSYAVIMVCNGVMEVSTPVPFLLVVIILGYSGFGICRPGRPRKDRFPSIRLKGKRADTHSAQAARCVCGLVA